MFANKKWEMKVSRLREKVLFFLNSELRKIGASQSQLHKVVFTRVYISSDLKKWKIFFVLVGKEMDDSKRVTGVENMVSRFFGTKRYRSKIFSLSSLSRLPEVSFLYDVDLITSLDATSKILDKKEESKEFS